MKTGYNWIIFKKLKS